MFDSAVNIKSEPQPQKRLRMSRILIATDTLNGVKDLAVQLRRLYYDVQVCFYDGKTLTATPLRAPAAIVCNFTKFSDKAGDIIKILKSHYAPRNFPVIGVAQPSEYISDSVYDTVLYEPVHASQIANRANSLIRLGAMELEIKLRIETLEKDFGQTVIVEDDGEHPPFKVLFIGKATPGFMVVINALQSKNVDTVAAFTSFSAFDYLHEMKFDAVVMNALEHPEPALSISETMRRNSRLFHVPTLFLVNDDDFQYTEKAHRNGARDIINISSDVEEVSGRILELANFHRLQDNLKQEFESLGDNSSICEKSGCFTKLFMERHADRVFRSSQKSKLPVSLMAVKPVLDCTANTTKLHTDLAITQFGQMLKNLVRMQDAVAYYDNDRYLIMLPGSSEDDAKTVFERIEGLVACTAFESGTPNSPLLMTVDYVVTEAMAHESSDLTIGRLISELENASDGVRNVSA